MPKLNLDNEFINKLNSIHRAKLGKSVGSKVKLKEKKPLKFPDPLKNPSRSSVPLSTLQESSPEALSPKINKLKFRKLVLKDMSDIDLMWESFDESIKKIVINEIIEKYYFYRNWKLNSKSFFLGVLFTFVIIVLVKLLDFLNN